MATTSPNVKGRKLLIAVSGGIAAYKVCGLVSSLVQAGAEVQVAMSAMATRFVGPLSFEALSGRPVLLEVEGKGDHAMEHIHVARWADTLLMAPCSANQVGKLAHGLGDDLLSTLSLAFKGKQLLAPAMNTTMWNKPSLQRNLDTLRADGFIIIPPGEGQLACGDVGPGRLAEEIAIVRAIEDCATDHP